MGTAYLCLAFALSVIVLSAAPSAADHMALSSDQGTPSAPERSSVDIDLKLGVNGFRLGAKVFGKGGYTGGGWLNGETHRDGFSVDGRLERDGKSWNFKLNADIEEALRRAMMLWMGGGLTDL